MGIKIMRLFSKMEVGEITNLEEVHDFVHNALDTKDILKTPTNNDSQKCLCKIELEQSNKGVIYIDKFCSIHARLVK